jgi:hypothetical protein
MKILFFWKFLLTLPTIEFAPPGTKNLDKTLHQRYYHEDYYTRTPTSEHFFAGRIAIP